MGKGRLLFAIACWTFLCFIARAAEKIIVWGPSLGPDSVGMRAVAGEFERRNPNYRLEFLSLGAGGSNPQKLMTAIVGGTPPDVIDQERFTLNDWAARGAFRPLDDLIAHDSLQSRGQFYDAAWQETVWKSRVYGIPTSMDDRALFWNRALFRRESRTLRAAGLDPTRAPRTWSELLAYSKALTVRDSSGRVTRPGFLPNVGNSWLYLYALENGATFLSPDGSRCELASSETVGALDFLQKLYVASGGYENALGLAASFGKDEADPFARGEVAMKIDGDWAVGGLARYAPDLDYGVAPPPLPDDRSGSSIVTWSGGWSLAIPRGARNVEGAWRWITFSTSPEAKRIEWAAQAEYERSRGRPFFPGLSARKDVDALALAEFAPTSPVAREAFARFIGYERYSQPRPITPAAQTLWDEQIRAVDRAASGASTPRRALELAQAAVQRELDAFARASKEPPLDLRAPTILGILGAALGVVLFAAQFPRRYARVRAAEARWGLVFILPWLIGFLGLTLGPMVVSLYLSFADWNALTAPHWAGGSNYAQLWGESRPIFLKSLENVAYVGSLGVPLGLFTSLSIALLLHGSGKGQKWFRPAFVLPSFLPSVAVAALWLWILAPDPARGLVNGWLAGTFHVSPPAWFASRVWSRPAIVSMGLWGSGGGILLWLAGLRRISPNLDEAAAIDGASPWQRLWSITLPQLSPLVFYSVVVGFIGALQQFDQNYVVTGGAGSGPGDTLLTPTYYLFNAGFGYFRIGYAGAIGWSLFLILLLVTAAQFAISKLWVRAEVDG